MAPSSRPGDVVAVVCLQAIASIAGLITGFDLMVDAYRLSTHAVVGALDDALAAQRVPGIEPSMIAQAAFLGGVLLVGLALLRAAAAFGVWQGRRWGRVVLAVLIVLTLVGGLAFLFQGFVVRAGLVVLMDAVLLGLLFDRRTSAFLDQSAPDPGNTLAPSVVER